MTLPVRGGDSRPWYRYFWPWFLIALPASVVVAGLSTAYIANRHADDLVLDDYYKDGLAINQQLEKKQRAAELGIAARLQFSGAGVNVELSGPVSDPSLQLLFSHPMEADRDFAVTLARVGPGIYRAMLAQEVGPHWHWTLQAQHDTAWRLDGAVRDSGTGNDAGR